MERQNMSDAFSRLVEACEAVGLAQKAQAEAVQKAFELLLRKGTADEHEIATRTLQQSARISHDAYDLCLETLRDAKEVWATRSTTTLPFVPPAAPFSVKEALYRDAIDALQEVASDLDCNADVIDGADGTPSPDWVMRAATAVHAAIGKLERAQ